MRILRTIDELRAALRSARDELGEAASVGFVPTMGALHEGHLSLVAAARAENPIVVLSIFVNPTQFNEGEDFARYPRDEQRDAALAEAAGVDLIFAPEASEMYPDGFDTVISVGGRLTEVLEGEQRGSSHFEGVATVVSKLLIAVQPDAAYFGEKDYQQLLVVRRMVADLRLPLRVVGCPTSREDDGLARSSRNTRLSASERRRAVAIPDALTAVAAAVHLGEREVERLRGTAREILEEAGLSAEYLAFVDPESLEAVRTVSAPTLFAVAARVGAVRLIDNRLLTLPDPKR